MLVGIYNPESSIWIYDMFIYVLRYAYLHSYAYLILAYGNMMLHLIQYFSFQLRIYLVQIGRILYFKSYLLF